MSAHPFCELAKNAVEAYVRSGAVLAAPDPLPADMVRRAATFVSLHEKSGELRGCIGTVQPAEPSVAHEIIRNAIAAASHDPRFTPVIETELGDLVYSVDVLSEPEPVRAISELDPKQYGVLVVSGGRRGLLLPDLEGVDSVGLQLAIAMEKGGIAPSGAYQVFRFRIERYH